MASIEDVAKKAKVSVTTVSRFLNNHPYISEKTQKKIKKAMSELNYAPNSIAQQLRGKGTKMIGVVISHLSNQFFSSLVNAIEGTLYEHGYQIVILQTHEEETREKAYLNMLKSKQLDGLIMTTVESSNQDLQDLKDYNIVLCNRLNYREGLPLVKINAKEATYNGIKYLLQKGHENIVFCTGADQHYENDERFQGFLEAFEANQLKFKLEERVNHFSNIVTSEDGRQVAKEVLKLTPRPTAIFANGDTIAAGLISQFHDEGIKIPEDIAVLGFDNQPISTLVTPKITTIAQPIEEMGRLSAELLIKKLNNEPIDQAEYVLPTELIIRDTV